MGALDNMEEAARAIASAAALEDDGDGRMFMDVVSQVILAQRGARKFKALRSQSAPGTLQSCG